MPTETKTHVQRTRDKIKAGSVLPRLIDHFHGKIELTNSQCTVGLKLLNKVVPDLKAIEHSGDIGSKPVEKMTSDEIRAELQTEGTAAGGTEKATVTGTSGSVH